MHTRYHRVYAERTWHATSTNYCPARFRSQSSAYFAWHGDTDAYASISTMLPSLGTKKSGTSLFFPSDTSLRTSSRWWMPEPTRSVFMPARQPIRMSVFSLQHAPVMLKGYWHQFSKPSLLCHTNLLYTETAVSKCKCSINAHKMFYFDINSRFSHGAPSDNDTIVTSGYSVNSHTSMARCDDVSYQNIQNGRFCVFNRVTERSSHRNVTLLRNHATNPHDSSWHQGTAWTETCF